MNILVTGANGQLGRCIQKASIISENNYIFTDVAELDITDCGSVLQYVKDARIDIIVNCAAYTDVDGAEDNSALAERINSHAVRNLAEAAKTEGALLIHISTDYVFGGAAANTPRTELDPVNPTGIYGITKLQGEEAILAAGCRAMIFRTAWLYSEFGHNFVKTMLNLMGKNPNLKVVFDQVGTPTYAMDLAEAICDIIEHETFWDNGGIYHFTNEGVCSWFDFAKAIAAFTGNEVCDIEPCHSCEFPSKVVRPSYSVLDKSKYRNTFGRKIPYWLDSLETCINNLKNES